MPVLNFLKGKRRKAYSPTGLKWFLTDIVLFYIVPILALIGSITLLLYVVALLKVLLLRLS
jgi:hypothetical protein